MEYAEKQLIQVNQSALMTEARSVMSPHLGMIIGAFVVYLIVSGLSGLIPLGSLLIGGPMALGLAYFTLNISRDRNPELGNIFEGFKHFGTAFVTYLLMGLGVLCAMILLIIPGFIVAMGWSQAYYIISDEPEISAVDALKKSWHMMDGYKMDIFILMLRFIPWMLLCILTLGLGLLYVWPWMSVTFAKYHDEISNKSSAREMDIIDHLID